MAVAKEVIIILAVLALAVIVIILIIYESKLKKALAKRKDSRNNFYRRKLRKIDISQSPEEVLDKIDELSKEFFKEAFGLECSKECSELIEEFSSLNNKECAEFCRLMTALTYAGEKASNEKLKEIASILDKIILKNKIPSKAEIGAKSTKKPLKE
ncbi:MAG: hypothetical protein KKE50_01150, partial [Nanoarchaeota archaeon]|nr:hypothetical protein [Nanoarchaeota archaeon]